ncbi:heterokaryon incompatibility protein-domain-containing protein [Chaetomidium leptoderma]|uniref:Heterokaryon incompatibility protein-domain-containing protein n=1 Tax=Chaetomidium leptoderma TaxID=669021 RepID=A0AAN6ZZA8_9PEZI|nr:heterokaryon incompatibility protein-domain-containing protein [Chaetomidium leptoderma]
MDRRAEGRGGPAGSVAYTLGAGLALGLGRVFISNLMQQLIGNIPAVVKQEFMIHSLLWTVLTAHLPKNGTLDWELLALGPKGGVPPPSPLLWTFGYNRLLVFAVLSVLCMMRRLYLGPRAVIAHSGDDTYGQPGWRNGLAWALLYHYPRLLLPRWGQWVCHVLLYPNSAPIPTSAAGLECVLISVLGSLLALPPTLSYATYRFADAVIHPLRRRWAADGRQESGFEGGQVSLVWFLRWYVLLLVPEQHFPRFCAGFALWTFWGGLLVVAFGWLALALPSWNARFAPESRCAHPPSEPAPWFCYAPLADVSMIRLLKVRPSLREDAPLICELLQVPLDGERPTYASISYRWDEGTTQAAAAHAGSNTKSSSLPPSIGASPASRPSPSEIINVNGFRFAVYPNVLAILRDVRSIALPRYFWIDSICINQDNVDEKEEQVALMRQIYEGSQNVIIHLGGPPSLSYLEQLRDIPASLWGLITRKPHKDNGNVDLLISKLRDARVLQDFSAEDAPGELLSFGTADDWDLLEALLENEWFVRAWIVQEVTVARRLRLRRRGMEMHWGDFVRACAVLSRSGMRAFVQYRRLKSGRLLSPSDTASGSTSAKLAAVENTLILDNLRQWYAAGRLLPLLDTLILCMPFRATWEVDKIYALLGVIDPEDRGRLGLRPDYVSDKTAVFQALACRLLRTAEPQDQFRLLRFAGVGQPRNMDDLPSWVPDWTAGLPALSLEHRNASADYAASTQPAQRLRLVHHDVADSSTPTRTPKDSNGRELPTCLAVDGYIVDRIVELYDISQTPSSEDSTHFPVRDALAGVLAHDPDRSTYGSTNQSITEAFWRTVVADRGRASRPATPDDLGVWSLYYSVYDVARAGRGASPEERAAALPFVADASPEARPAALPFLADAKHDDETWALRLNDAALWFAHADAEDLRFAHLLATDLSRRWPEQSSSSSSLSPGAAASVLNRPFDFTHTTEPRVSAGRQLCITARGAYFGLVPRLTAVGDVVVLFDGAKTPHVVRPSPTVAEDDGSPGVQCRLVGECFLHEGMDGQLERDLGPGAVKRTFVME